MPSLLPALAFAAALAAPTLVGAQGPPRFQTEKGDVIVETVAAGLENPWGLAFLPDGRMLVTERPGRLRVVAPNGQVSEPVAGAQPRVMARGQGGLLDVALDPNFTQDRLIYLSYAEDRGSRRSGTSVMRARLNASLPALEAPQVIFRQEPSHTGTKHYGSRLVFDRDGYLFVTVGDRGDLPDQAQNPANHLGATQHVSAADQRCG